MRRTSKSKATGPIEPKAGPITLASVLAGLDQTEGIAATRLRDLRSATRRVAELLGDTPSAVVLDMPEIAAKLGRIDADRVRQHDDVLEVFGLRGVLPASSASGLVELMRVDKKTHHSLAFVLDGPAGFEVVEDVADSDVLATLRAMGAGP